MNRIKSLLNKRIGFFIFALILLWIKTYVAYLLEFDLGVTGLFQNIILLLNPLPSAVLFLSLALYFKGSKKSYITMLVIYFLMSLWLFANILYYREFSDFITASIAMGAGGLTTGLIPSTIALLQPWDIIYWLDFILLVSILVIKKTNINLDPRGFYKRYAFAATALGIAFFAGNLSMAEADRPQLLERTFDRNYIVKYLGLNFFGGYNVYNTVQNNQIKAQADESDLSGAVEFVQNNHAEPNPQYFGQAEGRNVITISLESMQQFLIDYQLEGPDGQQHEVLPFLNDIYHSNDTYSFSNFFHQTGQGKSSDAEVLAETSLFGLPQGSAFQSLGSTNTFHAAPNILKETAGYTSAAFHGNTGTFWNRNDTYQSFGYDYFFDSRSYDTSGNRTHEYGLKDKLFFHDSAEYMQQLPQPFYAKFVTVSNHFPYPLSEENAEIPKANTSDQTINQYFQTANYADQAIEEFFSWLQESGVYENSIIVMYGDHYGVSNARNPVLGEDLFGIPQNEWSGYHDTQKQRVPMMIHIPGSDSGKIIDKYTGQVDILPTLLHLLGINTDPYLFMGQDMLSEQNNNLVTLRNGRVITPKYTFVGGTIYDTETGEVLNETLSEDQVNKLSDKRQEATEVLTHSDQILQMDLLRFYTPETLTGVEPIPYTYGEQHQYLKEETNRETSLEAQSEHPNPASLYKTNAPEMSNNQNSQNGQTQQGSQPGENVQNDNAKQNNQNQDAQQNGTQNQNEQSP